MSEYQYYEFVALDRPLSRTQMQELRALSTRAVITSTSFVNHYEWGNFRGDPDKMMERYFDAFLYLTNWGTRRVMLRLPRKQLSLDTAAQYCGDTASAWTAGRNIVLDLCSEDEEGDWETDGEGLLAAIVPIRDELTSGDLSALYLAWLCDVATEAVEDDELEPPVPDGLHDLSAAGQALAEYLRVDEDLLAEAAAPAPPPDPAGSAPRQLPDPPATDFARWVAGLPPVHEDPALQRLVRDGADLHAALLRRYHEAGSPGSTPTWGPRTVGELLAGAAVRREERHRLERERAAAEQVRRERAEAEARARRERAEAAAREKRLVTLARRVPQAWDRVEELISTRIPADYDAAVGVLADLHVLSQRTDGTAEFRERVGALRAQHRRKSSLLQRLDRAGIPAP